MVRTKKMTYGKMCDLLRYKVINQILRKRPILDDRSNDMKLELLKQHTNKTKILYD